ncbi:PilN domain-containing protein [uncultured Shewanella sp.]|uniref:PilN domain-containing protein n=1 Tax=Shewanella atlantica TaxID=271099 RepID=UPI002622AED1|nr:PilN domain-containing protein [uncultured Shewanella sp.]
MTMKTRVNLYSDSLFPPELRLSFKNLSRLLLLIIALFTIASGVSYTLVNGLESDKAQLNSQKHSLDNQKQELEAALASRAPDASLVDKVDLLSQQVELKRMLLGELSQREELTSHGYSPLMKDLARVSNSNIWLSRIQVDENNFIFEGFSSAPHSVPLWVERLKLTDTLKGHAFASMTMNRGDNQPLAFTLTSKAGESVESSQ